MFKELRAGLILFFLLAGITGLIYPLLATGVGQVLFPSQANGSLIRVHGRVVGSERIGQYFREPGYFWSRPSATSPYPYNADGSGASNLGPNNPQLLQHVAARVQALRKADPGQNAPVPIDLVTSSGSGLDPDISLAAAHYQLPRVARESGIPGATLRALIHRYTSPPFLGFFGEPVVNVVRLDLAIYRIRHGGKDANSS